MITPEKQYKKQTKKLAKHFNIMLRGDNYYYTDDFVEWLKQSRKELIDSHIDTYKFFMVIADALRIMNNDAEWLRRADKIKIGIERATGQTIEELIKGE